MSMILKQSTQIVVRIGPFVDVTDGFTPEVGVLLSTADEAEALKAAGAATVDISAATWAAITGADGWYNLTLTTSHTDTIGELIIVVQDDSVCLPVFMRFQIIEEAAYDAIYGTGAAPATTTSAVGSVTGAAGSVTGAVGSVTGAVGSVTGAVGSVTGAVGSVTGAVGSVAGNVDGNVTGTVGSVVGAVGSVTGAVGSVVGHTAQTGDSFALANGASGFVAVKGDTAAILIDTGTTLDAAIAALNDFNPATDAVANVTLVATLTTYTGNTPQTGDSYDLLNTASTEPGQGAPGVSVNVLAKLGYLYKAWRNKTEQTATLYSLYNDAGSTVDQKATVSDDATTATIEEVVTGP